MKFPIVCLCILLGSYRSMAQDLGTIGKDKKPFKIRGSVSASQILYTADGIPNRRPPYNYFLSGNLNISLYGWTIPLTYTFSNQQGQFQQPFNQYGATPYYKWVKLYVGYNSMSFSQYTLNGYVFLGGGVQLTPPGLFRFSAMYGRLNKAIEEDVNITYSIDTTGRASGDTTTRYKADTTLGQGIPYYERMGGGFKVGIGKDNDGVDLIFFTTKDDINSLKRPITKAQVLPGENVVISLVASKSIIKGLMLTGEFATSALTRDVRTDKVDKKEPSVFNAVPFFVVRNSTSFYNAYKVNLNYSSETYSIGIGFEHIDPGYRTFGAYYFNDDLENYVINGSKRLFKGKLNLAGNFGIQKNNLKDDKLSSTNRFVFGGNVNYAASPRLNFIAGYTNFQTFTRVKTLSQLENSNLPQQLNGNPDTLNFVQLSQSANLGTSYALTSPTLKDQRNTLNVNFIFQTAGDARSNQNVRFGTQFYNGTFSYNRTMVPQSLSMTYSLNTNVNELSGRRSILIGPAITVSKSFFSKKFKATASTSWTNSYTDGRKVNDVLNFRLGGNYTLLKKHTFNINITVIYRDSKSPTSISSTGDKRSPTFTEYTANMGYNFSF